MKCQACKKNNIEILEKSDDEIQPYLLCSSCHHHLINYALKPIEWFNLVIIHGHNKYYLHDDFYNEEGYANQAEIEINITDNDLVPNLDDVKCDLKSLLNYCLAKWTLPDECIFLLKKYKNHVFTKRIDEICEYYPDEYRIYEIVYRCAGKESDWWIRNKWEKYDEEYLIPLAKASAYCLPFEEGYNMVIEKLEKIQSNELSEIAFSCLYSFRSKMTLEWIEEHVKSPLSSEWGRLAAVSRPSWQNIELWLEKGRPYSLLALDTLNNLIPHDGDKILLDIKPKLENYPSIDEMNHKLLDYLNKDKVPRVRLNIKSIINNWGYILK